MPGNRLQQGRHRLLAPAKTLQLYTNKTALLPLRLESHSGRQSIHLIGRIKICTHRRGSAGGCGCIRKNLPLRPRLSRPHNCRPLLKVFGDRSLDAIPNPRLRNLKEKALKYRFRIAHVQEFVMPLQMPSLDTLSDHPAI